MYANINHVLVYICQLIKLPYCTVYMCKHLSRSRVHLSTDQASILYCVHVQTFITFSCTSFYSSIFHILLCTYANIYNVLLYICLLINLPYFTVYVCKHLSRVPVYLSIDQASIYCNVNECK